MTLRTIKLTMIAVAGLCAMLFASSAWAAFGNCNDASYQGRFDDRLAGTGFTCEERLRVAVTTEAGTRHIRLLHDLHAGWAVSPDALQDYERGIRGAVAALAQIGPFRMDDVTVLLIDGFPPRESDDSEGFSDIAGSTGHGDDECLIALHLLAGRAAIAEAAYVVAHEIFHCVQFATLSAAQMSSGATGIGSGGDWWLEGSAEWFAGLAVSDREVLSGRVARFDLLSPDTPLYEMAYPAAVFFLWLGGEHGAHSIVPLLNQMAGNSAASAQRSAMRRALGADEWLAFAQAYLDRSIRYPDGSLLPGSPTDGDTWRWNETRTETVTLEPFVLHRGWVEFDCGRWLAGTNPEQGHAVRPEGGAWGLLPERIDTRAGDDTRFRFAGFAAQDEPLRVRIRGDLEAGCASCGGVETLDACLIGTWEQSGGGPIAWMQREVKGVEIPRGERRNVVEVFRADGTYWTGKLSADLAFATPDGSEGDGEAQAQTAGRWSAEAGALNLCQDRLVFGGTVTMTSPDGQTLTRPVPTPTAPEVVTMEYSCTDSTLETRLSIQGVSAPMETQYRRIEGLAGGGTGGVAP